KKDCSHHEESSLLILFPYEFPILFAQFLKFLFFSIFQRSIQLYFQLFFIPCITKFIKQQSCCQFHLKWSFSFCQKHFPIIPKKRIFLLCFFHGTCPLLFHYPKLFQQLQQLGIIEKVKRASIFFRIDVSKS